MNNKKVEEQNIQNGYAATYLFRTLQCIIIISQPTASASWSWENLELRHSLPHYDISVTHLSQKSKGIAWWNSIPSVSLLPDIENVNIKYFIALIGNRIHCWRIFSRTLGLRTNIKIVKIHIKTFNTTQTLTKSIKTLTRLSQPECK